MFQVIFAFIVGGFVIALLSLIAEKSPPTVRGLVISFPSTLAVSFILLTHEFGADILFEVLPGVLYSLFGSFLFAITFAVVAQSFAARTPAQKWPIVVTFLLASAAWFLIALCSVNLPRSLAIAFALYVLATVVVQRFLWRYAERYVALPIAHHTSFAEFVARAAFAGTVVSGALILSRTLGPFWGALVGSTFPASFGSQLVIFQNKYPASQLPLLIRTVPLGVTSVVFYAICVAILYPQIGVFFGTLAGMSGSVLFSLLLARVVKRFGV